MIIKDEEKDQTGLFGDSMVSEETGTSGSRSYAEALKKTEQHNRAKKRGAHEGKPEKKPAGQHDREIAGNTARETAKELVRERGRELVRDSNRKPGAYSARKVRKRRISLKTAIIAAIAVIVIVVGVLVLFTDSLDFLKPSKPMQGVMLSKETNEESVYSLSILSFDEIEIPYIKTWIESKKDAGIVNNQPVYYTLYNDDFEKPMEMYLYMPLAKDYIGDITLSNVTVDENGKALVLNIETKDNISKNKEGTDLILHIYVEEFREGAQARTDRLFINGKQYNCPGATFTRLN